jgi:hypothetical protein
VVTVVLDANETATLYEARCIESLDQLEDNAAIADAIHLLIEETRQALLAATRSI